MATPPVVREIIQSVAQRRSVSVDDMLGQRRMRDIVRARYEAMAEVRALRRADGRPRFSTTQIGAYFGRDHATVLHGLQRWAATAPTAVFTGCPRCLDTGWAFVPHSDEARERCDCQTEERTKL